jgi:hypothetical protein
VCAAKPRRFPPRRPGAGYIALSRRHGSALYTGHPLGRRSGPICVFPGRATEAVEAAHVPVHPPNLKEDGKSPQSGPSDLQENPCYCNNPPPLTSSSTPVSKPQPFFPPTSSHVGCHLFVLGRGGDSAVPASASVLPCTHRRRPRFCPGRVLSAAAGPFQQACT